MSDFGLTNIFDTGKKMFNGLFNSDNSNDNISSVNQEQDKPAQATYTLPPLDLSDIPMHPDKNHPENKNPVGVMGRFLKMFMNTFKPNLKAEFAANTTRGDLTEEEEMDPKKSKSFLPTVGRALINTLPTMVGGFISMLAELFTNLFGFFFKPKAETLNTVKETAKTVGHAFVLNEMGDKKGFENVATVAAPLFIKGLTQMLNLGLTEDEMKAATPFPKSATFTPKADVVINENNSMPYPNVTAEDYGVDNSNDKNDPSNGFGFV